MSCVNRASAACEEPRNALRTLTLESISTAERTAARPSAMNLSVSSVRPMPVLPMDSPASRIVLELRKNAPNRPPCSLLAQVLACLN